MLVLVKGDRRMGSQVSPTTHRMLVLVKGDRRTRSQVSPTTQILVLVKGDRPMGSQVKKKNRERKKEEEEKRRKREQKKESKVFKWVDIEQVKQAERQVFLYKAYYAKHWGVLLRKHCKKGASVATQFLTHVLINFQKNSKNSGNIENPKKLRF